MDGRAEASDEQAEDGEQSQFDEDGESETDADLGEEGDEGMLPMRPNRPFSELSPSFDYRAFSEEFDEIVAAQELCDDDELTRLRAYLDQQQIGRAHV